MEKEAKNMERANIKDYLTSQRTHTRVKDSEYENDLNKYCDQIESERDELKLKEQIAYNAKETAQDAHQKLVKERDGLKEKTEELEFRNEHLQEQLNEYNEYKSVKDLQALKDAVKECEQAREWYKDIFTQSAYNKYEKKLNILKSLIK